MPADLLTPSEIQAVNIANYLYTYIDKEVVADGPTRDDDLAQLRGHIHGIQHAIMSQAAARAYPAEFRLLGDVITTTQEEQR